MNTAPDAFDQMWAQYPRREKKQAARDAFRWAMQNHNRDGQLLDKILATIAWQAKQQPDPRFWQMADKWLLGRRWEDEPPVTRVRITTLSPEDAARERLARAAERARVDAEHEARMAARQAEADRVAAEKAERQRAAAAAVEADRAAFRAALAARRRSA